MTFGGCADTFILDPTTGHRDAGRAVQRFIEVDGRKLEVYTARPAAQGDREPDGFVLEFCGKSTRAEDITQYVADRWESHAVEVWVMNYPGYGDGLRISVGTDEEIDRLLAELTRIG